MTDTPVATQQWLDTHQYTTDSIRDYERVFGENFVSPGGERLSRELLVSLNLVPDQRVLDVGCGLGGSAFLMAREFHTLVTGIDLSANMLGAARKKLERYGWQHRVTFEHRDCLTLTDSEQFDAIYSRDVFLHIADKRKLFSVLQRALKGGGQLLFTDYACGPTPWHPDFERYAESRGYHLLTLEEYADVIVQAGFSDVHVEDWTEQFIDLLQTDLSTISKLAIDEQSRQALSRSWLVKLERARGGDHRWIKATARATRKKL